MQALILAAGMGTRLSAYTATVPKCMVPVNGTPMIERSIEALISAGIRKLVIGLGYKGDILKDFVTKTFTPERLNGMKIEYAENPLYDSTNNIYSLYLAKDFFVRDDTILLESDLVYDKRIIRDLVTSSDSNLAVVSPFEPWMDGTCTLLDRENHITGLVDRAHFRWQNADSYYKTVNIYKFSKKFINKYYLPFLESYQTVFGKNEYYETVLEVLTVLDPTLLKGFQISGDRWYEIDDPADLNIAENKFSDKTEMLDMMIQRGGGSWRFPSLKDFTNTANAFFPTPSLLDELKTEFPITYKPSSHMQENLLASKLFRILPEYIVAGSSVTELEQLAANSQKGTAAMAKWQYVSRHTEKTVVTPSGDESSLLVQDILDFSKKAGAHSLVLSNPDCVTGRFIDQNTILALCDSLEKTGTYLIVDETYANFADQNKRYTLVTEQTLRQFPNLIVVQSLSEQYGVPGLNLAVLASSSKTLITHITRNLPEGNISSIAEYFMQILEKYKKAYQESFTAAAAERNRLFEELKKISILKPVPGQANAIVCKVTGTGTAIKLAEKLLQNNHILVQPISPGLLSEQDSFIRIAVRTAKDNDLLICALRKETGC